MTLHRKSIPQNHSRGKTRLILFAKEPVRGKVKTRLAKDLSSDLVLKLYQAFVTDLVKIALKVKCDERVIYYTGDLKTPFLEQFRKGYRLKRQRGRDLGERMFGAFVDSVQKGFEKTVMIGTDCLSLTPALLSSAFQRLNQYDLILGPSRDGGYYLIGLSSPHPALFTGIPWSTDQVFPRTMSRARQLRQKVYLLRPLEDIDTLGSLKRFIRDTQKLKSVPATHQVINSFHIRFEKGKD